MEYFLPKNVPFNFSHSLYFLWSPIVFLTKLTSKIYQVSSWAMYKTNSIFPPYHKNKNFRDTTNINIKLIK